MQSAPEQASRPSLIERTFHVRERGSTVSREVLGGVTTFMALSYIIFVQPAMIAEAGARTGLASVATPAMLLLSLLLYPVLAVVATCHRYTEGGFFMSQYPVLAPALIVVGSMMLKSVARMDWDDPTEFLPAFLTIILMPMTLSITEGIAFGFIAYTVLKLVTGRLRDAHWGFHVMSLLLALRYVFLSPT